jgi:hypothetical protein
MDLSCTPHHPALAFIQEKTKLTKWSNKLANSLAQYFPKSYYK